MGRKRGKKERYVMVCPKCGSTDIKAETNPAYAITGLVLNFKQCMNCGHHGQFFPEELRTEVRKTPKKREHVKGKTMVEVSFGRGYMKYLLYILIPLFLIFLLLRLLV